MQESLTQNFIKSKTKYIKFEAFNVSVFVFKIHYHLPWLVREIKSPDILEHLFELTDFNVQNRILDTLLRNLNVNR